jgi:hypothetical protein
MRVSHYVGRIRASLVDVLGLSRFQWIPGFYSLQRVLGRFAARIVPCPSGVVADVAALPTPRCSAI